MDVQLTRNREGVLETRTDAPRWKDGCALIRDLKKRLGATIIQTIDGPDCRQWEPQLNGSVIVVHHDDWGKITIWAKDSSGEHVVKKIAESLRDAR